MRNTIIIICAALGLMSCFGPCTDRVSGRFSDGEAELICEADSTMRVLTIEDSLDLAVLRASSQDLTWKMLLSDEFQRLSELMIATVTHRPRTESELPGHRSV